MPRNMQTDKTPMPEQKPEIRSGNFEEVALGYTAEMAQNEAKRCLQCKHRPCVNGCPVNVRIPDFIDALAVGRFDDAYDKILATNALPAVCGRVCPQESQCEALCVRGKKGEPVAIGRLERFAADYARENRKEAAKPMESNGHKVAILGAGPAGLTCASDLNALGYEVTVFEAFHKPGGVLVYGIPEFRLPKEIVKHEIDGLKDRGVQFEMNVVAGRTVMIPELFEEGFEAIFIGTGAGLPSFLGIPGESSIGVYSANEFLTRINLMRAFDENYDTPVMPVKKVIVVGGGNVAMDAARCARRLGAEVTIVYRRSEEEIPARREEIHHAKEEGVIFELLTAPLRIFSDDKGYVTGMECCRMGLGEPDASGRRRPVEVKGSEFSLDADSVIVAVGTSPNPILHSSTDGLEVNKWGCISADEETGATSLPGVFAGGDAVTGAATVILAMGAGKKAAVAMDRYVREKNGRG